MQGIGHRGETSPVFLAPSSGLCQLLLSLASKSLFPTSEGQLVADWKAAVVQQPTATPHTSLGWEVENTQCAEETARGSGPAEWRQSSWNLARAKPSAPAKSRHVKTPQEKASPLLLPAEQIPLPQLGRSAPGSRAGVPSCPLPLWTPVMMRATKQLLQHDHSC